MQEFGTVIHGSRMREGAHRGDAKEWFCPLTRQGVKLGVRGLQSPSYLLTRARHQDPSREAAAKAT